MSGKEKLLIIGGAAAGPCAAARAKRVNPDPTLFLFTFKPNSDRCRTNYKKDTKIDFSDL